jgi:hypothetical protein
LIAAAEVGRELAVAREREIERAVRVVAGEREVGARASYGHDPAVVLDRDVGTGDVAEVSDQRAIAAERDVELAGRRLRRGGGQQARGENDERGRAAGPDTCHGVLAVRPRRHGRSAARDVLLRLAGERDDQPAGLDEQSRS